MEKIQAIQEEMAKTQKNKVLSTVTLVLTVFLCLGDLLSSRSTQGTFSTIRLLIDLGQISEVET
jgi:hypothetical protein